MAEKQYLVTRCDEESLQHSRSHKYIDRYYKNGRYNYVYDEKTGQARSTIQGTSGGQHKKEGVEGRSGEAVKGQSYDLVLANVREIERIAEEDPAVYDWFCETKSYDVGEKLYGTYGDRFGNGIMPILAPVLKEVSENYKNYQGEARVKYLSDMDNKMLKRMKDFQAKLRTITIGGGKSSDSKPGFQPNPHQRSKFKED